MDILNKNSTSLDTVINNGYFNQILDEYLFSRLAKEEKCVVRYLVGSVKEDMKYHQYDNVLRFNLVPIRDKYIHLLGLTKVNKYACQQLELRFEYEFPDYYRNVVSLLKKQNERSFEDDPTDIKRKERLRKLIPLLYNGDISELLNVKFQLIDDVTFHTNGESSEKEELIMSISDPLTNEKTQKVLAGTDIILTYFTNPISIHELLEELRLQEQDLSKKEYEMKKFKLLDVVTEKVMIEGLLQVANKN